MMIPMSICRAAIRPPGSMSRNIGACGQYRFYSTAQSARIDLAYEVHKPKEPSEGPAKAPILFLHGFLGSKRENRHVSKMLAQDTSRPVFTLDLRNHGDSGHHPDHNYMEMALDVKAFMQKNHLENPTLIGHSMGAKTALTLALHSPDEIANVVAIDNCPIKITLNSEFGNYLRGLSEVRDAGVKTHKEAEEILKNYEPDPAVRLWLLANLIKDGDTGSLKIRVPPEILEKSRAALGDFPYKLGQARYDGPALFVRGLRSHYIPDRVIPQTKELFPKAEIVDIDCGHWVVQEEPEQLRQAIVEFLEFLK